jgi:hypothetical protein
MLHLLNENQKQNGFSVCKDLQVQAENNKNISSKVITGDGSWLYGL